MSSLGTDGATQSQEAYHYNFFAYLYIHQGLSIFSDFVPRLRLLSKARNRYPWTAEALNSISNAITLFIHLIYPESPALIFISGQQLTGEP